MWPIKESMCDLGRLVLATAQPETVLEPHLGVYPSKDTKFSSTQAVSVTFCSDIATSKDDTDRVPEVLVF